MKKCGLLILSFVLLSGTVSAVFSSSSANAWSGDLPACSNVSANWYSNLKKDSRYNDSKTAFIVFQRTWYGAPFNGQTGMLVAWDNVTNSNSLYLTGDASNHAIDGGTADSSFAIDGSGNLTDTTSSFPAGAGFGMSDLTCVTAVQNMTYASSWTGNHFPTAVTPNPDSKVNCNWYDAACWVGQFSNNIINSLQDMWNSIVQMYTQFINFLTGLFVPSDQNIFLTFFSNLNTTMHQKLGFLTYPFDFVGQMGTQMMTLVNSTDKSEWHCVPNGNGVGELGVCGGICVPNVLGSNQLCVMQVGELEQTWPALWNATIIIGRAAWIISIIELCRLKYFEVVKG